MKDQAKRTLSAMVVGKSLVRYWMMATFKKKGWMKLTIHTGKCMTQLLMSQLALMMKTITTRAMNYMKRSLYSRTKFHIHVVDRIERSENKYVSECEKADRDCSTY